MIRPVTTHTQTLHRRLRDAADQLTEGPVSLAHLARIHGSAMQGTLLVLLATPCVLPIPGIGNVLGLALMAMALALWRGDDCSTLPKRIAEIELSAQWARRVLTILARANGGDARNITPGLEPLRRIIGNALTTYTSLALSLIHISEPTRPY